MKRRILIFEFMSFSGRQLPKQSLEMPSWSKTLLSWWRWWGSGVSTTWWCFERGDIVIFIVSHFWILNLAVLLILCPHCNNCNKNSPYMSYSLLQFVAFTFDEGIATFLAKVWRSQWWGSQWRRWQGWRPKSAKFSGWRCRLQNTLPTSQYHSLHISFHCRCW